MARIRTNFIGICALMLFNSDLPHSRHMGVHRAMRTNAYAMVTNIVQCWKIYWDYSLHCVCVNFRKNLVRCSICGKRYAWHTTRPERCMLLALITLFLWLTKTCGRCSTLRFWKRVVVGVLSRNSACTCCGCIFLYFHMEVYCKTSEENTKRQRRLWECIFMACKATFIWKYFISRAFKTLSFSSAPFENY